MAECTIYYAFSHDRPSNHRCHVILENRSSCAVSPRSQSQTSHLTVTFKAHYISAFNFVYRNFTSSKTSACQFNTCQPILALIETDPSRKNLEPGGAASPFGVRMYAFLFAHGHRSRNYRMSKPKSKFYIPLSSKRPAGRYMAVIEESNIARTSGQDTGDTLPQPTFLAFHELCINRYRCIMFRPRPVCPFSRSPDHVTAYHMPRQRQGLGLDWRMPGCP